VILLRHYAYTLPPPYAFAIFAPLFSSTLHAACQHYAQIQTAHWPLMGHMFNTIDSLITDFSY